MESQPNFFPCNNRPLHLFHPRSSKNGPRSTTFAPPPPPPAALVTQNRFSLLSLLDQTRVSSPYSSLFTNTISPLKLYYLLLYQFSLPLFPDAPIRKFTIAVHRAPANVNDSRTHTTNWYIVGERSSSLPTSGLRIAPYSNINPNIPITLRTVIPPPPPPPPVTPFVSLQTPGRSRSRSPLPVSYSLAQRHSPQDHRVGIDLPTIEVKFEHLTVEADVNTGSRAIPVSLTSTLISWRGVHSHIIRSVSHDLRTGTLRTQSQIAGDPNAGRIADGNGRGANHD
ncbi:hypothetical protein LXL04_012766 [Taraxacum kok-saghyz]